VTRYGHNEVNLVSTGDQVGAGREIALVGATGRSKGPHLHFEVHQNGQAVDPMQVLGLQGEFNISKKG
jgi:murein DD-endopeptidase MepM/ murein hydrolase activator NlpD